MKLKNIKNSVIVLNSVWICKGKNNPTEYDGTKTKFTVDNVYEYLRDKITDTSKKEIGKIDDFKKICKTNTDFIKKIIENNLENLKEKDKGIKLEFGTFCGKEYYKSGPLNGYFDCNAITKKAYTVDDSIKKHLYDLIINSLKKELIEKLENLDNQYNTTEKLNVEINKLKNGEKYKYIIDFGEIKSEIENIIKNIKLKTSENKDDKKDKHETDKTKEQIEEEKKKQIEEKNKKLNEKLNDLMKSDDYSTITSNNLAQKLNDIKENENIKNIFKIDKVDEKNKELISQIETEIQTRGTKEIDKANRNKPKDQLKNELNQKLNDIITNNNKKKSLEIQIELNSILDAQSYKEILKEEEIDELVKKITEIIENKKKEEEEKKDDEDPDDEEPDEEDKDKNYNEDQQTPSDSNKKKKPCSSKGKDDKKKPSSGKRKR